DAARRAEVAEHAVGAARRTGDADPAAVPDQEMREDPPPRARDDPLQVALDLHRLLLARQAEALREPPHVRVDDDALRVSELGGRAQRDRRIRVCPLEAFDDRPDPVALAPDAPAVRLLDVAMRHSVGEPWAPPRTPSVGDA